MATLEERFWSKVKKSDGCWLWTGARSRYGYLKVSGKGLRAHRLAWEFEHGPIPVGLQILHRCDTPACVRVDHLFAGTQRDNVRDMETKGRARHPRGKDHGFRRHPDRPVRGEKSPQAKLNEAAVRAIRAQFAGGTLMKDLAIQFGVSAGLIGHVVSRRNWRHVA